MITITRSEQISRGGASQVQTACPIHLQAAAKPVDHSPLRLRRQLPTLFGVALESFGVDFGHGVSPHHIEEETIPNRTG
jgi:hypothetical protein